MWGSLMATDAIAILRQPNTRCRIAASLAVALLLAEIAWCPGSFADETKSPLSSARFRGPVALVLTDEGKTLLAANRRAGTISIVDVAASRVVGEVAVGKSLSALVTLPGGQFLLATDEAA